MNERPIHKFEPRKGTFALFTYCGVDGFRKGVRSEDAYGTPKATCKACIKLEAKSKELGRC